MKGLLFCHGGSKEVARQQRERQSHLTLAVSGDSREAEALEEAIDALSKMHQRGPVPDTLARPDPYPLRRTRVQTPSSGPTSLSQKEEST